MRSFLDPLAGLLALLRVVARSGFRVRSPYWRWRYETAFGHDPARRPPRPQRLRGILDYARWVHRMNRAHPRR